MAKLEIELLKTEKNETSQFTQSSTLIHANCKQQWQDLIAKIAQCSGEKISTRINSRKNKVHYLASPQYVVKSAFAKHPHRLSKSLQFLHTESNNLVDTENNLFHMPGMKLSSPRIFTKDIQTKQNGEDYTGHYEKRSISNKLSAAMGLTEEKPQNYFDHWRLYAKALKKQLKKNGAYKKEHSEIFKQFIEFIDKKELEAKYTLLKIAYEESEKSIQRLTKENNLKAPSMPAMDFTESFSRKDVLDKVRKVHNQTDKRLKSLSEQISERNTKIKNAYYRAIESHKPNSTETKILYQRLENQLRQNQELKSALIQQTKYSHSMSKLWLDTLEEHASKSSRPYISKLRHFTHGMLGILAFACLATVITAGIIMSGPFAPAVVLTAAAIFTLATKIGLVCAVFSFGFLAGEMITNKVYYHQNPSVSQMIQLGVTITFASMGFVIKSVSSAVMWLVNSLTKLFLQTTKGVPKNTSEIKHSFTGHEHVEQSSSAFILQKTQKITHDPNAPLAINTEVNKKDVSRYKKQLKKALSTFPGFMQSRRKMPDTPLHHGISQYL